MKARKSSTACVLKVLAVLISSTGMARADDCRAVRAALEPGRDVGDRELFYRTSGTAAWTSLEEGSVSDLRGKAVDFAYVIWDRSAVPRSGVVLIKTARLPATRAEMASPTVSLARTPGGDSCAPAQAFKETPISARSYDDYHELGLRVPEKQTLQSYHVTYRARGSHCRRTNDDAFDSIVPWDKRSNVSQFSFDPDVVANGTRSQFAQWFMPTAAYAQTRGLASQRVDMRHYKSDDDQPVCIRFTLSVTGPGSFVRVNDLEAGSSQGLRFSRAGEQVWQLSPDR
ncbi:MAG: hypothetical protein K2X57_06660 [Xanthobacteraceae bacterium]|nr:hypothetical protein [Xanthobacteraceae bacterium]